MIESGVAWSLAAIAAGTLISEDLTAVSAGLLAAEGRVPIGAAAAATALGIWAGDLGLWASGRLAGPALNRPWMRRRLERIERDVLATRVDRHAATAILASRLLPGSRLPLYLAAGALGVPFARFALWTAIGVAIWTPIVVIATYSFGDAVSGPLRAYFGAGWILIPPLVVMAWHARARLRTLGRSIARYARWEFWPPWLFYAPVVPWVLWLMVTRGVRALTAANPGLEDGGFVGESKAAILARLPAPWTLAAALLPPGDPADRLARLRDRMSALRWAFPIVLKPDVGQRGDGVRLIHGDAEALAYFQSQPRAVIAQVYHPGPYEVGIFYFRRPSEAHGRIFSITDKRFPSVVGDGETTLRSLILGHRRYRLQARVFLTRHRDRLARVPAAGETVRLGVAGNHAQGTMFLDGSDLLTDALARRIDRIAQSIDGFHVGRFDIRYRDPRRLMAGEDFAIVELNGVSAEATHIYDPSGTLWNAYRTLFRQWSLVFEIGAANLRAGHAATPLGRLLRLSVDHLTSRAPALIAD